MPGPSPMPKCRWVCGCRKSQSSTSTVRPVSARVWAEGDRIKCVINDRGHDDNDPLSGFLPAHGLDLSLGGMGLWLARKLWDHVDVLPTPQGLSVRLSTRLH